MQRIYVLILQYDVVIYIICAFGLFWYISEFLRARQILQRAMFNLEWETGTQIRNTAVIFILFFGLAASGVYYVNREIAPTLPEELFKPPTPTVDIFATRLASPTPLDAPLATATLPPVATITLPGQSNLPPGVSDGTPILDESGTPIPPEATPTSFIGCNVVLNISDPRNGSVVTGSITFFGTADTENFGYYTLEANGPETNGQWATLLGRNINQTVQDALLGTVNLSQWQSGPYLIRLTAVDQNSNETGQCIIQITLDNG